MYRVTRGFLRSRIGGLLFSLYRATPWGRRALSTTAHPTRGLLVGTGEMREDWDRRASEHGRFYTAIDYWESEEQYTASGEHDIEAVVLEGVQLDPSASVLEIGCGLGRLLVPLATRAAVVRGVDISVEMVRQANERLAGRGNVEVQVTDGTLGFPDESFDLVFAYRVFHHIPKREFIHRYFQEAGRVLKPGGVFRFQVCVGEEKDREDDAGTWFGVLYTEAELHEIMPRYGFELVEMHIEETPERKGLAECLLVTCLRRPKEGAAQTAAARLAQREVSRAGPRP